MSYSYSYKSNIGGAPVAGGNSSYHYSSSSSGGSAVPLVTPPLSGNPAMDLEFQRMQAEMAARAGAPIGLMSSPIGMVSPPIGMVSPPTGSSSSYSYKSSSSSSSAAPVITSTPMLDADLELARMKKEMLGTAPLNTGVNSSSYTYKSSSSSAANGSAIPVVVEGLHPVDSSSSSSGGHVVKKTVTTTTTKVNPEVRRDLETIERDFSRIGRPVDYHDDFEKIKQEVLTGAAYQGEVSAPQPQVSKIREEIIRTSKTADTNTAPTSRLRTSFDNGGNSVIEESKTTTTKTYGSAAPGSKDEVVRTSSGQLPNEADMYRSELFIPIKRYDDTFDDFHMNRWRENSGLLMDTDLDLQRRDWERRLEDMKRDFFKFSPSQDTHHAIESSRTVGKSPLGKPEFSVQFDVKDFKPEEINVSTKAGKLTISATHEEKHGNSTSRREFKRTVDLPSDIQVGLMRSVLSRDGILSIHAPIKPPTYEPQCTAVTSSNFATSNTTNSIVERGADSHNALNYNLSIAGYSPEEITVTVEGRRIKVHALHEESVGGRKTHNEMTKMFDLPPSVDAHHVRSYIKDGHTLYIEAQLRDDLGGKIHVLPVNHKYI